MSNKFRVLGKNMKKIFIGILLGILLTAFFYSAYTFFSFASQRNKQALYRYEHSDAILYKTYLECKKCKEDSKSAYDCALDVSKRDSLGRFTSFETLQEEQKELLSNRIQSLKTKCTTKSIEELKADPYLYCGSTGKSVTLGSGTNYWSNSTISENSHLLV